MKYIFFDVESANSTDGNGNIFSIGYLIADENLNIIQKEKDILINPNVVEWDNYVIRKILAYPKSLIEAQPTFDKFYNKFKKLFEGEDVILCGFDVLNDIAYLLDECKRYNLEPFKLKYLDIQRLETSVSTQKKKSLALSYVKWCRKLPSNNHRSDYDARYTYEISKSLCNKTKTKLEIYLQNTFNVWGETDNFKYGFNNEIKNDRCNKLKDNRLRIEKAEQKDFIIKHRHNDILFIRYLDFQDVKEDINSYFNGKKISISLNYENYHFRNMIKLIKHLNECGATYVKKASLADIFVKEPVVPKEQQREKCTKLNFVLEANQNGSNIEIIEFDELLSKLNLMIDSLNELPEIDIEYLNDKKYQRNKDK